MKNVINKIILFITIIIFTLLSGYFIFQSYMSYKGYTIAQSADKYIFFIKNTNIVLQKIEQECSASAVYLGYEGKMDFSHIQTYRDETDKAINNANQFISKNPKFLNNLQYVRSRVDVISSDYEDIFFTYYQDEISDSLLKEIKNSTQELSLGLSKLKKELYAYNDFITYRNSINKEKSFIAYILSLSKKMSTQDLILWENILTKGRFPIFDDLNDKKIISDITAILQPQNFSELNFKARVGIVRGVTNGNYQINTKKWFENTDQRIRRVILSEEKLYDHIQSHLINQTSYPKALIYNIIIALFLLLSLFSLIRLQKGKSKNIELNNDIVRKNKIQPAKAKSRSTDTPKSNIPFDNNLDESTNHEIRRATDIPLTNSMRTNTSTDKKINPQEHDEEESSIRSFNPMEEFAHIINLFTEKTGKKDIGFKYKLDPTLPRYCVGDIDKINEALYYLLNYIIKSSNSKNFITLNIDNIAQTKLESAIRFSLKESSSHFTNEEIKEIRNAAYVDFYNEPIKIAKLSKAKENLIKVSQLISTIDGSFKIKSSSKNETDFLITINLKRE